MADYHPLIARAVAGLDKNTGENRRALYERARTALVAQLRGVNPPLEESEITRERLALEEAIRKVEAESARHARETARPTFIKRAEVPRGGEPAPPPQQPVQPPQQPARPSATTTRPAPAPAAPVATPPAAAPRAPARPSTYAQTRTATAAAPQQAQPQPEPAPPPPRTEPLPPRPAASAAPAARKSQTL